MSSESSESGELSESSELSKSSEVSKARVTMWGWCRSRRDVCVCVWVLI